MLGSQLVKASNSISAGVLHTIQDTNVVDDAAHISEVDACNVMHALAGQPPQHYPICVKTFENKFELFVQPDWKVGKIWEMMEQVHSVERANRHLSLVGNRVDEQELLGKVAPAFQNLH